jgi:hypothetical protein
VIIYIPVLNEGGPCWRPVEAEHISGDTYRITEKKPEGERWPVRTGDTVRCESRRFSDDLDCLVAIIPGTGSILPNP